MTPGNVHDSVAFDDVYDKVTEHFPEIGTIVADAARTLGKRPLELLLESIC